MISFTPAFRFAVTTSVVTVAITLGPLFTAISQALTLNGAGATFPKPLYDRYIAEFSKKYPDIKVNYEGIGSGGGIKQLIAGTVDFAGSDAAMTDTEIGQVSRGVEMVPTAGGAVAVVYNLPGVFNLKLSRSALPAIFAGQITRWNDPKIAKDNPGVSLPDRPIKLAVRADGSGTTFIFTNHLSAVDSYFKSKVGVNKAPNWSANPLKGKGNPGVAALVQQTEGSIGYVESAYAKQSKLLTARVENKKGRFVSPSLEEANKALANVQFPANFRVFEGDPADGYPITGLTWLLVYKQYDAEKADAVKKLVQWCLTDGQKLNGSLEYTQIPPAVATRAIAAVNSNVASR
ncbi:MAG: phosphate ABC transporter substrate-binding protein PstS [Aphanothece sp. CMT-3BRIN-NPC111]|jgi:phosphate transport system substrate-binding protein|nr:phosphate ABC transporter substrate-binding protein PstS [Aphanothece sp. CMT-3BRIN-NPC111]